MSDQTNDESGGVEASSKFLSNGHLEMLALRLICSDRAETRSTSLATFKPKYFYNEGTQLAIRRIRSMAQKTGHQMSWRELTNDSVLPKGFRSRMKAYISENADEDVTVSKKLKKRLKEAKELRGDANINVSNLDTVNTVEIVSKLLDDYSRTRAIWEFIRRVVKAKSSGEFNIDTAYEDLKKTTIDAGAVYDESTVFTHEGLNDNASDLVNDVLEISEHQFIPTGFKDFDDVNGGILRGTMMLLGANTSGGKSALALQLAMNSSRAGARVCYVPLEMTAQEMMQRQLSNLSGIEITKIVKPDKLSPKELKKIRTAYKDFSNTLKSRNGQLSIFSPPEDMDMDTILQYLKPNNYDMIIIDYLGLLAGLDGDDQWRTMTNATRSAKIFAMINNNAVICAAQLAEDGTARYSKGMADNANMAWYWKYDSIDIAKAEMDMDAEHITVDHHTFVVEMPKSRNQKAINLKLYADFAHMRIEDFKPEHADTSTKEYHKIRQAEIRALTLMERESRERTAEREENSKKKSGKKYRKPADNESYVSKDKDVKAAKKAVKKKRKSISLSESQVPFEKGKGRSNTKNDKNMPTSKKEHPDYYLRKIGHNEEFEASFKVYVKKKRIGKEEDKGPDRNKVVNAEKRVFAKHWVKGNKADGTKDTKRLSRQKRRYIRPGRK